MSEDARTTREAEQRFVARMRAERKQRKLTQDQVARLANVPTMTITRLETGDRRLRIDEAVAIAEALDLPLDDMLNGTGAAA